MRVSVDTHRPPSERSYAKSDPQYKSPGDWRHFPGKGGHDAATKALSKAESEHFGAVNDCDEKENTLLTRLRAEVASVMEESAGVCPSVERLLTPPEAAAAGSLLPQPCRIALRSKLFDAGSVPPADPIGEGPSPDGSMLVSPQPRIGAVQTVSTILPLLLAESNVNLEEVSSLIRALFRFVHIDVRPVSMLSEVYLRMGKLSDAFVWAMTAWALSLEPLDARFVQMTAECVVKAQPEVPPIALMAMTSRAKDAEADSSEKHDKWASLFQQRCHALEGVPPFRQLSTERILPSTLIIKEEPVSVSPCFLNEKKLSGVGTSCIFCLRPLSILDTTHACPVMPRSCPFSFCSFDCFIANAEIHQHSCQFIHTQLFSLASLTGFTPAFILLALRLLLRSWLMRKNSATLKRDPLICLSKLPTTLSETQRLRPDLFKSIHMLGRAFAHFLPLPKMLFLSADDMDDLLCRVHDNCFVVTVENPAEYLQGKLPGDCSGLALSPEVCTLGHSCIPNCHVSFDGATLRVRAVATIPPQTNLCISTIQDLYQPTSLRKHPLATWKVIDCGCERCLSPCEGSRFVEAVRCRECIFGWCLPRRAPLIGFLMARNKISPKEALGHVGNVRRWECTSCGLLSPEMAEECEKITTDWRHRFSILMETEGDAAEKRIRFASLFDKIARLAHPFHYILYNLGVRLVGLFRRNPAKSAQRAMEYQRLVSVAAMHVLNRAHPDFIGLGISSALLSFELSYFQERSRRPTITEKDASPFGPGLADDDTSRGMQKPLIWALYSAYCCYGAGSAPWLCCLGHLRRVSLITRRPFIPLPLEADLGDVKHLRNLTVNLWPSQGCPSLEQLELLVKSDPLAWWFAAARSGHIPILRACLEGVAEPVKRILLGAVENGSGFTALGVLGRCGHVGGFKLLLEFATDDDLSFTSEWGLTIPCYMASSSAVEDDANQTKNLKALLTRVKKAEELTLAEKTTPRLLNSSSHELLGSQTVLHLAAVRGKSDFVGELLRWKVAPNITNKELATPLHLASLMGHLAVCDKLVEAGARLNALTYRGETPLMLAAFGLHLHCVDRLIAFVREKNRARYDTLHVNVPHRTAHALIASLCHEHVWTLCHKRLCLEEPD